MIKKSLFLLYFIFLLGCSLFNQEAKTFFLAAETNNVEVLNKNENIASIPRGSEVTFYGQRKIINDQEYLLIKFYDEEYYVLEEQLVLKKENTVLETKLFVRTSTTVYLDPVSSKILGLVKKGESLVINGFDRLDADGSVNMYQISYQDEIGYVYSKYLVADEETALSHYDEEGLYQIHLARTNRLGGGGGGDLDYFPREKPQFPDNIMPNEVRALYLTINSVRVIDRYIDFAKENNINGLVIDIKDNTMPGYKSPVMEKYSPTNYDRAPTSFENYQTAIQKALDADLYLIGRITIFKDSFYVRDHPESAILNKETKEPLLHNNSHWPSPFRRDVWEFNVKLAKEAVLEMGFHEIQFDYVRFPDRINRLEEEGKIDLRNQYDEEKAAAIQTFLMYATDEIHQVGAYVSADVFGESAHTYVTAYGQYWPAISNVVDVISAMPYPDHFSAYEYGFEEIVWTVPYELLTTWGEFAEKRQTEIPTPAISRTWIQTYNAIRRPFVEYDAEKIADQIRALYKTGHTGGFMTWNAAANLKKYEEVKEAFRKEY